MSLGLDIAEDNNHAMLVSRSNDGGRTWGPVSVLKRDTSPNVLNDKNSMTADPFDSQYVYAIWDRLEFPKQVAARQAGEHALGYRGPTWFTRTSDGGATWEPARMIYDPGAVNQTIGNQVVVTGSGALVDGFDLIYNFQNAHKVRGLNVAVLRSEDRGATWSAKPTIVDSLRAAGVKDPTSGAPVRTGDIIPEIAADSRLGHGEVYAVWQDSRSTGGDRDQVAFAKSTDGGKTWKTLSYAINGDHRVPAFTPSIAVGPDGTISVAYYDFRNDDSGVPLVTSAWILHSHDGGATWDESKVGGDFDMSSGAVARGYFIGDYSGLAVANGAFTDLPVFANGATPATAGATSPAAGSNVYSANAG
jgi:Neuraminidase (sialidase)